MSDWWNDSGTAPTNPNWWMQTGTPTWGGRTTYRSGGGGPTPRFVPKATVPSTGPSRSTSSGGQGPYYPVSGRDSRIQETSQITPFMSADRSEQYVNELVKRRMEEAGATLPDAGMTWEEFLKSMQQPSGGGGGGGSRMAAAPRWSQKDIDALMAAGQGARTNIGGAWDAASNQLQQLLGEYAAADAARRAGAAQTLGAFGAPTQLDVGGLSASDVLRSMLGQTAVTKASELANQDALLQAYQSLLGKVK